MQPIQFFNGEFLSKEAISFSVDDVGILRGYAIFDYFKAHYAMPIFMADHLDRFYNSAKLLGMEVPFSREAIEAAIRKIISHNHYPISGVKILMTGGNSPDGFTPGQPNLAILNSPVNEIPEEVYQQGVSLMTYEFTREFPEAKSTNYATALKLQAEFTRKGHMDVLYHDSYFVSEVARSNVFLVKDGKLITNHDGVLPGITRKKVLEIASNLGFEILVRPLPLKEVFAADELFITSTNKKVMPIVKLDDTLIASGSVGPKTMILLRKLNELIFTETGRKT